MLCNTFVCLLLRPIEFGCFSTLSLVVAFDFHAAQHLLVLLLFTSISTFFCFCECKCIYFDLFSVDILYAISIFLYSACFFSSCQNICKRMAGQREELCFKRNKTNYIFQTLRKRDEKKCANAGYARTIKSYVELFL